MYPLTYSQYDEEQAILAYFAEHPVTNPQFLDIGAWDPEVFSNVRRLYIGGWCGVVIDPSPHALMGQLKMYGNDRRIEIVSAAVGLEHMPIKMHMTADSVSTSDPDKYAEWKEKGGYIGMMTVQQITWADINRLWGGFQFVNIDAEGCSVDLFHAMLTAGSRPECLCVEHDGPRFAELAQAATVSGYKILYSNGTNAVMGR